jgi:hypothetical protein
MHPLHSRAWALQEYVPSKHVLIYGRDQLVWQCNESEETESAWPNIDLIGGSTARTIRSCHVSRCPIDGSLFTKIIFQRRTGWHIAGLICARRSSAVSVILSAMWCLRTTHNEDLIVTQTGNTPAEYRRWGCFLLIRRTGLEVVTSKILLSYEQHAPPPLLILFGPFCLPAHSAPLVDL